MTSDISDFIGVFDDVVPKEMCLEAINFFETMKSRGESLNRQQESPECSPLTKKDEFVFMQHYPEGQQLARQMLDLFWAGPYKQYADEYPTLHEVGEHSIAEAKLQKTLPGGGYHIWHAESSGKQVAMRIAAYTIYLNDVEDGGETEFLFQHRRVKPKAGRCVIFPAGFTHTHRGNPPLTGEKYIVTGWLAFI